MTLSQTVTVNIRSIAVGGAGVGEVAFQDDSRTDLLGITAFVPFTAPGEVVTARVVTKKDRYLTTEPLTIRKPSSERVEPKCRHFGSCGGCELQHMSEKSQREAKLEMVQGALRVARMGSEVLDKLKAIKGDEAYGYRRRVTLHVDSTGRVGFYRANSRSVVPIEHCPIAVDSINAGLEGLQDFGKEIRGKVSSILLEADNKRMIAVLKAPYDLAEGERRAVMTAAEKCFSNVVLIAGEREIDGFGSQILELSLNTSNTLMMRIPAASFAQIHWPVNISLIDEVLKLSGAVSGKKVYDLFSGAGNFSLPLARGGAKVTAVEVDKRLSLFAKENAQHLNLQRNLLVVNDTVEKFLAKHAKDEPPDVIVADPPRTGIGKLVSALPRSERLVLVFCHVPSLVRDLKALVESNWKVDAIECFDMFPQTSYVETVVSLRG